MKRLCDGIYLNAHKRKLTAKLTLLPCGDVMNWDSPDNEDGN